MFDPYVPFSRTVLRRLFEPDKPVRHQQTCPLCGRKLVNTYLREHKWMCRRCWEEQSNNE